MLNQKFSDVLCSFVKSKDLLTRAEWYLTIEHEVRYHIMSKQNTLSASLHAQIKNKEN